VKTIVVRACAGKPLHQLVSETGMKTRALKDSRPTARVLDSHEVPRQVCGVCVYVCVRVCACVCMCVICVLGSKR